MVKFSRKKGGIGEISRSFLAILAMLLLAFAIVMIQNSTNNEDPASSLELFTQSEGHTNSIVGKSKTYTPVSCPELFEKRENEDFYDPNRGMPESPKKQTLTEPPFWISLHKEWFDKMRWISIMHKGLYYEVGLTNVFKEILSNTDAPGRVIDVGMNIGWFSLLSRSFGHEVAAFEPNPMMHVRVCESLALNNWNEDNSIKTFQYGLGNEETVLNLVTGKNPGASSFFEDRINKKIRIPFPVDVIRLDSVAEQEGWLKPDASTIHLWKVDVEGFESQVFSGSKQLLSSGKVTNIIMENSSRNGEHVMSLLKLLYESGYKVKTLLTVNGDPYHEHETPFINDLISHLISDSMSKKEEAYADFLVTQTCNVWWIKRD